MSYIHVSTPKQYGRPYNWFIMDELVTPKPKYRARLLDKDGDEKLNEIDGVAFEEAVFDTADEAKRVASRCTEVYNSGTSPYPVVKIEITKLEAEAEVVTPKPSITWS